MISIRGLGIFPHPKQAREGEVVYLSFVEIDIEWNVNCQYDQVIIYDGPTDNDPRIGSYCGNVVPTVEIKSSKRDMLVVFASDGSITGGGFNASYECRGLYSPW